MIYLNQRDDHVTTNCNDLKNNNKKTNTGQTSFNLLRIFGDKFISRCSNMHMHGIYIS